MNKDNMTPIETLFNWLSENHYYIGNDLLEKVEELRKVEEEKFEKLKNFDTWKEWKNKSE